MVFVSFVVGFLLGAAASGYALQRQGYLRNRYELAALDQLKAAGRKVCPCCHAVMMKGRDLIYLSCSHCGDLVIHKPCEPPQAALPIPDFSRN